MTERDWLTCEDPLRMVRWLGDPYPAGVSGIAGESREPYAFSLTDRKLRLFADGCRELGFCAMRFENVVEDADHMARCSKDEPNQRHVPGVAALLRDIIGNPWRPVTLPKTWVPADRRLYAGGWRDTCDWLTPTVLGIARRIYEERDFAAMPILADALEDAGCNNEEILRHCRNQELIPSPHMPKIGLWGKLRGPHVRGCWVLDLLLGKE